jgi:hypothetical protein
MGHMYDHFKNIEYLYGNAYVQIPNGIFKDLQYIQSNTQQSSFAYAYLVAIAFLYKYAHFVDVDNGTYVQNNDIKQVLGYGKSTKTVDKIIKKNGILEEIGLIATTKSYPVQFTDSGEEINGHLARDFITIDMIDEDYVNYEVIKSTVKNRNYEIKEPTFFFDYKGDVGTLYDYSNTHKITIQEFMRIIYDESLDNIHFLLYGFFKSRCFGYKNNTQEIALYKIVEDAGVGKDAFYSRLDDLKKNGFLEVKHKPFVMGGERHDITIEGNEYIFKGVA